MNLPSRSRALRGHRVGVAGAGLAGLTAAWALERHGADVFLFEARQRIGGRVLTLRNLPGAAHGEAGADIIEEDDQDAVRAVAEELGLSLRRILPGGFKRYDGAANGHGRLGPAKQMFDTLRSLLRPEIDALERAEQLPSSAIAQALARRSALDWARAAPQRREAVAAVESLRAFFVAEPSEYSLLMLVQQVSEEGDPASMKLYRIGGGNGRLADALAASLKRPPQLATRLVRLQSRRGSRAFGGRIVATLDSRDARSTITCDGFVVALPATMAREIEFSPSLPPLQRTAIGTLPYGRATKALVSFDRRFWRRRGHAFATQLPIGAVWEAGVKGSAGTLAFLAGGDTSADLADLVARGSQADWQRALKWLGIGSARVIDATAVTWEKDPYARGAYAHQSPSFDPSLSAWLSAPFGRIAFAGEHTSGKSQGYMEGAVMSGLRAADDVEISLTSCPTSTSRSSRARERRTTSAI